jgi:hypothetical protein
VELSAIEADRAFVYLGFLLAAFLLAQTNENRERFAEGIAIGLAVVVLAGLGSRLLPHVIDVTESLGSGSRLRYPLGYWNANATMCATAVAMLLWMSRGARWAALRWLSVAVVPAALLTLYFTYSRGGLITLAVACGCLLILSADRLWLLATLAIGGLGALPALLAVQARHGLAENTNSQASVDQGVTVLLILLAGTAAVVGLYALLRRAERGEGKRTGRALALSRNPKLLKRVALAGAIVAVVAVAAVGHRAWDQFSSSEVQVLNNNPSRHFSNFSGTGRHDFWRVAVDAFGEEPLIGHGAGTFSWNELRSIYLPTTEAHSLYLEMFAELGVVGGLLVIGLVLASLWVAFVAWRSASARRPEAQGALLAAMLAFAVAAAFDWFWQIAMLGAVFFLGAGAMAAARCEQLPADEVLPRAGRRFGLAVATLAVAWLGAIALIGPLLVEHEIDSSQGAVTRGDLTSATDHAETARSIEPWAASPYLQLGLVAEQSGDLPRAAEMLGKAIDREDRNWVLYALRSRIEREAGEKAAAQRDYEEAHRLNPLEPKALLEGRE